jgi:urease accessory protein UreH
VQSGNRAIGQGGGRGLDAALSVAFSGAGARISVESPLELRGPIYRDGVRSYYLRNVTAGVFAGDAYRVDVIASAGTEVRIGATSATKVHAMPAGCATSAVVLQAEAGSRFTWGPHATILQADSDFRQSLSIQVEPGSTVYAAEVLVLGRLARGENGAFRRYASGLVIDDGETVRFEEHFELTPGAALATAMGGRGGLVSVYALGELGDGTYEQLGELLRDDSFAGVTRLPNGTGLLVRALTESLSAGTALAERVLAVMQRSAPRL